MPTKSVFFKFIFWGVWGAAADRHPFLGAPLVQPNSLVYTYIVDHMPTQFQIVPDLPELLLGECLRSVKKGNTNTTGVPPNHTRQKPRRRTLPHATPTSNRVQPGHNDSKNETYAHAYCEKESTRPVYKSRVYCFNI
jgi:hypothetical protein